MKGKACDLQGGLGVVVEKSSEHGPLSKLFYFHKDSGVHYWGENLIDQRGGGGVAN